MAVVYIPGTLWAGGLASGHGGTLGIIDILDIIHSYDHSKFSSFISQLINSKSWNLQKLIKYSDGKTTSAANISLSSGVLPINFVSYLKYFLVIVLLLFILLLTPFFLYMIIYFISIRIPQISRCHRIIVTVLTDYTLTQYQDLLYCL